MKCVIQRVISSSLIIDGKIHSSINNGLLVLVGYNNNDDSKIIRDIVNKIVNLRIFNDENNKLNLSVNDIEGEIMLIPNFSIYADASHGRRPDFSYSARAEISKPLYEQTCEIMSRLYEKTQFGVFGANMQINLINDGPLTIILEK